MIQSCWLYMRDQRHMYIGTTSPWPCDALGHLRTLPARILSLDESLDLAPVDPRAQINFFS
jgi:hypothetical protein